MPKLPNWSKKEEPADGAERTWTQDEKPVHVNVTKQLTDSEKGRYVGVLFHEQPDGEVERDQVVRARTKKEAVRKTRRWLKQNPDPEVGSQ